MIRLAPEDLELVEIPIRDLPLYSQDYDDNFPPEARALKDAIAAVQAVLFVTPEFNRSIPGGLKNAIDWASRPHNESPLRNKPVAVIGASTGMFGAVWAQAELRKVLASGGARVAEVELAVGHANEHLDLAGHPSDPAQAEALRDSVGILLGEVQQLAVAA